MIKFFEIVTQQINEFEHMRPYPENPRNQKLSIAEIRFIFYCSISRLINNCWLLSFNDIKRVFRLRKIRTQQIHNQSYNLTKLIETDSIIEHKNSFCWVGNLTQDFDIIFTETLEKCIKALNEIRLHRMRTISLLI